MRVCGGEKVLAIGSWLFAIGEGVGSEVKGLLKPFSPAAK